MFGTSLELPGGQAEAVAVPAADASVLKIPEGITDEQAVLLTDILPTGYLGAQRADITPGDVVVVIGLGPVGVFALQCAQLYGPSRILAVDMVPDRLARAAELGAEPIDASDGNTVAKVYEATGGRGADAVIEAVGADQTDHRRHPVRRPRRHHLGHRREPQPRLPVPDADRARSSGSPSGSRWRRSRRPGRRSFPLVASGKLHPEDVFTHRMGLSEAAEAYRIFDAREDGVLKVLLDPTG